MSNRSEYLSLPREIYLAEPVTALYQDQELEDSNQKLVCNSYKAVQKDENPSKRIDAGTKQRQLCTAKQQRIRREDMFSHSFDRVQKIKVGGKESPAEE